MACCHFRGLIYRAVTITEDSRIFQDLLTFIYPDKTPTVFSNLDVLMSVLDAATKYDMKAVTNALAGQLMSKRLDQGRHQEALIYTDPLRVYAKAKEFELVDLANAAANASLNLNSYATSAVMHKFGNMPASWAWELLDIRERRIQWWLAKIVHPIAFINSTYGYVGANGLQCINGRASNSNCGHNTTTDFRVIPVAIKEKIRSCPCAKAVRGIDFCVELKCLRCGAALNASFKKLCDEYDKEFGTF